MRKSNEVKSEYVGPNPRVYSHQCDPTEKRAGEYTHCFGRAEGFDLPNASSCRGVHECADENPSDASWHANVPVNFLMRVVSGVNTILALPQGKDDWQRNSTSSCCVFGHDIIMMTFHSLGLLRNA
jgi:hypothetical protein